MDYETNFGKPSLNPTSFRHKNINNKHLERAKNDICKRLKVESSQNSVLRESHLLQSKLRIITSKYRKMGLESWQIVFVKQLIIVLFVIG